MHYRKLLALFAFALFAVIGTANANPINPSFESGLTGWNLGTGTDPGNVNVISSAVIGSETLTPVDGNYFLALNSPDFGDNPTYLWQNIGDLNSGTTISFSWTSSGTPLFLSGNFFQMYSGASEVLNMPLTALPILNGSGTSWHSVAFNMPTSLPDATLGFKVLGSPENNTLYIDNVNAASVPEPSTIALLAAGGLIGLTKRPSKTWAATALKA